MLLSLNKQFYLHERILSVITWIIPMIYIDEKLNAICLISNLAHPCALRWYNICKPVTSFD